MPKKIPIYKQVKPANMISNNVHAEQNNLITILKNNQKKLIHNQKKLIKHARITNKVMIAFAIYSVIMMIAMCIVC